MQIRTLTLLVLILFMAGCYAASPVARQAALKQDRLHIIQNEEEMNLNISEYSYEGCTYIVSRTYGANLSMSHKGSCSNPIHFCSKENK